jgi:anti-anti-sigma factor
MMELNFKQENKVGIIEVKGRLDAYHAPELRTLYNSVADKAVNFVFDMAQCDFVDSTGLGTIVACLKSASQGGGVFTLPICRRSPEWCLTSLGHIRYFTSSTIWKQPSSVLMKIWEIDGTGRLTDAMLDICQN